MASTRVLVTGANGFVGSNLVYQLLKAGTYHVTALVRNAQQKGQSQHLRNIVKVLKAEEEEEDVDRKKLLKIVDCSLLFPATDNSNNNNDDDNANDGNVNKALERLLKEAQAQVVFHCASPFYFKNVHVNNYQQQLLQPAVTLTSAILLAAANTPTVKAVIVTSSLAAISYQRARNGSLNEQQWSDVDYMKEAKLFYPISKTVAEKEAWSMVEVGKAANDKFKLCTVLPSLVIGPKLQPKLNTSLSKLLPFLKGQVKKIPAGSKCYVDVRDVARAHIFVMKLALNTPTTASEFNVANHRYLCVAGEEDWSQWCAAMKQHQPTNSKIPSELGDENATVARTNVDNSKLTALGFEYKYDFQQSISDSIDSLIKHKHLVQKK